MLLLLRQARYLALMAGGIVLAMVCVLAAFWQVHRYDGKHDVNAELRHNDARTAVPVSQLLAPGQPVGPDEEFRRITARGHYDVADQMFVRQRQIDNHAGYLVLTPLRTDAGPVLLVVRGWVPIGGSATQTPTVPPPPNTEVTLTGRVYPSEPPSDQRGLPTGQIERIDVPGLADRLGAPTYGGYVQIVSQQPTEHGLRPMPEPDLSNPAGGAFEGQHLAYIVQWFFFGALALAAPPILAYKDARERAAGSAPDPTGPDPETDPETDPEAGTDDDLATVPEHESGRTAADRH